MGANISRYSYLISLLPDQIMQDLSINFETISRKVSSYTPTNLDGLDVGLLVNRHLDSESQKSFTALTGGSAEFLQWEKFYNELSKLARIIAPTMLQPLLTRTELREIANKEGLGEIWKAFIEEPLGEIIRERFRNDLVRGVVLTDGLIGTFAPADSFMANICFLYHLIGNGTGEWKVPLGGMGALTNKLVERALELGVQVRTNSKVTKIEVDENFVSVEVNGDEVIEGDFVAANCAPQVLAEIMGWEPVDYSQGSQLKVNLLLKKLPRLKSGVDPIIAFAGTFHINESYSQLEQAYQEARNGKIPEVIPAEMYCHTITDSSILSEELIERGYQTLTLFALHLPYALFQEDNEGVKAFMLQRIFSQLNEYLLDPIEDCLARDLNGNPCVEVKSPIDLEANLAMPRGNIFHKELDFPFKESDSIERWGTETDHPRVFICGAGAVRGGGVSGIGGHNAAMAILGK
jgi:phytoene dehydrogenase-like protein